MKILIELVCAFIFGFFLIWILLNLNCGDVVYTAAGAVEGECIALWEMFYDDAR